MSQSLPKIKVFYDRILVRLILDEEKTAGGIIIPDTAKEKPQMGEIIAAGAGRVSKKGKVLPMNIKVGDKVLFPNFVGVDLEVEGKTYLLMRESDVLGTIR